MGMTFAHLQSYGSSSVLQEFSRVRDRSSKITPASSFDDLGCSSPGPTNLNSFHSSLIFLYHIILDLILSFSLPYLISAVISYSLVFFGDLLLLQFFYSCLLKILVHLKVLCAAIPASWHVLHFSFSWGLLVFVSLVSCPLKTPDHHGFPSFWVFLTTGYDPILKIIEISFPKLCSACYTLLSFPIFYITNSKMIWSLSLSVLTILHHWPVLLLVKTRYRMAYRQE